MKRRIQPAKDAMFDVIQKLIVQDAESLSTRSDYRVTADRVEDGELEWLVTGHVDGAEILGYVKLIPSSGSDDSAGSAGTSWNPPSHAMWFKDSVGC